MRSPSSFTPLCAFALLALLLAASALQAVITKLTPLAEVLESDQYIFVAKVEKLDPEKPSAVFTVDKKLKGEPTFDRLPVNMTGDDEAKKAGDTKTIMERLEGRQVVFFVRRQGKLYNAKAFTEGTWFSVYGTLDADGKTVRWAFLHGEPFLRRTFKGTTAEMVKVVEEGLAKKAKPPEPDEKEKPGYGPAAEKVPAKEPEEPGDRRQETGNNKTAGSSLAPVSCPLSPELSPVSCSLTPGPLFGVIPSVVFVGPLALLAVLFPGVMAPLAMALKRWRAFLVVASVNSTLALAYWAVLMYRPHWLPPGRWLSPRTFTVYLIAITAIGLLWAGRRYRRFAADEPDVTATPGKRGLYTLLGLTVFAVVITVLTAVFASWDTTLELPMREFTFIGIALLVATAYAGYRTLTKRMDVGAAGTEPPVRLSLSGESVALGTLLLCGLFTVLLSGAPRVAAPAVTGTVTGDAEADFAVRYVEGSATALEAVEVIDGKNEPAFGRVWSSLAHDGDRLYFGVEAARSGRLFCMNRHSGKLEWAFDAPGLKPVYCTPTVAGGKVYCGEGEHTDTDCRLFCLNAANGEPVWKEPFKTASHTEGAPAVSGGRVYFPAGEDGVYCADAATGEKKWHFPGGKEKGIHVDAAPAVANGTVFVGSGLYSYIAVALDANTGNEKWRTDLKHRAFGAPLAFGSKVFYGVGTGNMGADTYHYPEEGQKHEREAAGAVVCLDAATGKVEWRYDMGKSVHTGLTADAFSVYAGSRDGFVYAIDRKSGKLRWKTGIGGAVMSCPAVAASGGHPVAVYAVSREGLLVCLNPLTGAAIWQQQLPGFQWDGTEVGSILCSPVVVTTPSATGSRRTIYVGGMTKDPQNPIRRTVAIFRFEDALGE